MRWMLGMFEACLAPGVNFYLSCWYKRTEFGLRAAFFFSAATVSGAFGGLLAAAISNMDGIGGKPAWALDLHPRRPPHGRCSTRFILDNPRLS
ncbi:hypothetical protein IW261DRAFT_401231 [Armillaria novae-zelandiae]|uniref:Major facilitator superfamily (MFS) profile domain-containing protein n=1 Tax=Armillaria novae-zelandiae TaxID=153914 RepID=A0AA39UMI6_9AGAR|nr:hypothetical protein IW261DRAFT_401231 [Armillaria novae-zelandiae]